MTIKISDSRAIDLFLDMMAAEQGAAANTLSGYRRDLESASTEAFHNLAGADITGLENIFAGWTDLSPASLQRRRSALRRFFGFLVDEGIRSDNPALRVAAPASGRRLPKILSVAEVDSILCTVEAEAAEGNGAALRNRALFELLYGSGLRATELVSLPRHAIRPGQPFAIVKGKGGKERLVPISPAALTAVDAYAATVAPAAAYLFPSGKSHLSRVRLFQIVREVAGRAGIPPERISPHVLRHAFATHMLANGADLRSLQTLLGHVDISTTEIYTHVETSRLKSTVETLHPLADKQ